MTLDFARNYQPPGVYVDEDETSIVSVSGIPPTTVAIVGPARGYQVASEQFLFDDTDPYALQQSGVILSSIVVTVGNTSTVVDPTDYVVDDTGSGDTLTATVVGATGTAYDNGTTMRVTYQYTPVGYFSPLIFSSFEDVKDIYGEPLNLVGQTSTDVDYQFILSPLSLAAKVAFDNGASQLYLCATTPPTGSTGGARSTSAKAALTVALNKMLTYPDITVITPLTNEIVTADAPGVLHDFEAYLADCAEEGFFRFGVIGFPAEVTSLPDAMLEAQNTHTQRMCLAYAGPSAMLMYSGANNTVFAVGHQYLAAAYAGLMGRLPVQQSITKQRVVSFAGLAGTPLANTLKNQYAVAGVAVTEVDRAGHLVVRHGVTTDPTNVNTREISVVRARDALVALLQSGTNGANLIGLPMDGNALITVKSVIQGLLETAVAVNAIVAYTDLAVRITSTDPSVVEVKFAYKPAYPLNYILISFSIDMSTGSSSLTGEATTA